MMFGFRLFCVWFFCGVFLLSGCKTTKRTSIEIGSESVERLIIAQKIDEQKQELETIFPEGTILETANNGATLKIIFSTDIFFVANSNIIHDTSKKKISQFAENLNKYPDTHIRITCHTDNTGRADYNQTLTERRAKSFCDYLNEQGVSSSRKAYSGKGFNEPVADNFSVEGRAMNRRVEIFIIFAQ